MKFKIRTIVKALILFTFISFPIQFQQQMKHQINKVNSFIDQDRGLNLLQSSLIRSMTLFTIRMATIRSQNKINSSLHHHIMFTIKITTTLS